ncbi:PREDICTED: F-box protein At5g07610-like [Camelina sativa]|uniref:F-box protein At5g07610-like n=1 Tax=Camelina sativa TaxID=90675 RepID=A0ABM0TA75_CAMSA|nr:PREDICTED: F-box protein At5g07610-like [Camelina sativa]
MSSCSRTRTKAPRSARSHRKGRFSSSSLATIVADIDDVLTHILSFLPIKTLLRSKRVSKRWLSLITNPDFSNRVIKSNHPLPISGFFLHSPTAIKYSFVSLDDDDDDAINQRTSLSLPLWFTDHSTDMIIIQSTNGLLLCKCACASFNQYNTNYYVYNPTTKQYTLLPHGTTGYITLTLAFDPSESPHYKVFCLRTSSMISSSFHIEVYSSNEGHWKRLVSVPSSSPSPFVEYKDTVFWNGAVHCYGPRTSDCISFDINKEEIKILPLPNLDHEEDEEPLPDPNTLRYLDESGGNLYFIEVNDQSSSDIPIYEMERNSSSWSLKYNVDLEPLLAAFPEMIRTEYYTDRWIYTFSVIRFVKEETDAESYIVLHIPNKAVKYNFITKTFKKLCPLVNDAPEDAFYRFQRTFQFIESLANV